MEPLVFIVLCLLLSFGVSTNVDNSILTSDERTLVWLPSKDGGLFSHFFQLRYINSLAQKDNRKLVIAPHTSIHATDDKDVVMCDILKLDGMVCVNNINVDRKKCAPDLNWEPYEDDTQVCFLGHNIWGAISLVDVMKLGPPLTYQETYLALYRRVYSSFVKALFAKSQSVTYMIIHWRRGDQLTTRCTPNWKGSKDTSLNCESAASLIAHVKKFMRTSFDGTYYNTSNIFVATNEQNTSILNHLRSHNFIPISDVFAEHYDGAFGNLTSLDEFVLETQFMLNAPMFISFGISQINDVIESERMALGYSFCLMPEENPHKSWCEDARIGAHLENSGGNGGGGGGRMNGGRTSRGGNGGAVTSGRGGAIVNPNRPGIGEKDAARMVNQGGKQVMTGYRVKPRPPLTKEEQRAANKQRNDQLVAQAHGGGDGSGVAIGAKFKNRDGGRTIQLQSGNGRLKGHNMNNP